MNKGHCRTKRQSVTLIHNLCMDLSQCGTSELVPRSVLKMEIVILSLVFLGFYFGPDSMPLFFYSRVSSFFGNPQRLPAGCAFEREAGSVVSA